MQVLGGQAKEALDLVAVEAVMLVDTVDLVVAAEHQFNLLLELTLLLLVVVLVRIILRKEVWAEILMEVGPLMEHRIKVTLVEIILVVAVAVI